MLIHHLTRRMLMMAATTVVALIAVAQKPDIVNHITAGGKVAVEAPQGLTTRSNEAAKSSKNDDGTSDDETDKNKDKDKKSEDANRPVKRTHTTQQTIQSRGVGYRIQAYNDNNPSTGKTNVQKRARAIAMRFPQYRSYISYNAPAWRLRIGDFKSQADAQAALSRIRSVFPQYAREMSVVRDKVNVWSND